MEQLPVRVRAAIADGQTLEAIRVLRELTGMSLSESEKAVLEASQDDIPVAAGSASARVLSALDEGRTLDAVRLLRDDTGLGLRDAKLRVDAIMEQRGIRRPKPDLGLIAIVGILVSLMTYFVAG